MQSLARGSVHYQTRALPLPQAESFAACLRANPLFSDVALAHTAKGARVQFKPTNPERVAAMVQGQQDARQARADDEGRSYLFVLDKDGGRPFCWVFNPLSGATYEVTEHSCDCPDDTFRACPGGCKHRRALRQAVAEGRVESFQRIPRGRAGDTAAFLDSIYA